MPTGGIAFRLPTQLATEINARTHPKLNANDDRFWTFRMPLMNLVFQCGDKVWVKGLKSKAGRRLNGKLGTAVSVSTMTARFEVKVRIPTSERSDFVDDETFDDATGCVTKSIKTENLELRIRGPEDAIRILHECHEGDPAVKPSDRGLENVAAAGTHNGQRALCFWPQHGGAKLREQFLVMGVPEYMLRLCLPEMDFDVSACNLCGDAVDTTRKASNTGGMCRCKMACYCSAECQRADWGRHRIACKLEDKRLELMDALNTHSRRLEILPRPDGKPKPFVRMKDNVATEPVVEFRVCAYPHGRSGEKIDTGVVVAHRVDVGTYRDYYENHKDSELGDELNEIMTTKAVGKPFYYQHNMVSTFYKAMSKGEVFGQRKKISEKEATDIIKEYGGKDRRFTNYVDGKFVLCENFDTELIFACDCLNDPVDPTHVYYDPLLEAHGLGMLCQNATKIEDWPKWG